MSNYQVPEGYKQTEVGVIPENWDVIPITKSTNEIFLGLTARVDYVESGGVPLVRATDIAKGELSFDKARTISIQQHKKLTKYRRAKRGDVLVSKSGSLGVCAIVDTDQEFSIYESIIVLQVNSSLDSNFLLSLVRDEKTQVRMIGEKVGSTVGHLNLEMFRKLVIPLPPLPEQRAIAQALSDVDALIAALDKLIAKQRHLKTATMQQLLTGKKRLPGFGEGKGYKQTEVGVIPEDWSPLPLGEVIKLQGGYSFKSENFSDVGISVVRISDIQNGIVHPESTIRHPETQISPDFIIKEGDILIAMSGATTGKVGFYCSSVPAYQNQRVGRFVLRNKEYTSQLFVGQLVCSARFLEVLSILLEQGAQPNISSGQIESLIFPFPRSLEEQRAIATVLSDMDGAISALETRRAKTQAIKQGMMQELLTGRTRLTINP